MPDKNNDQSSQAGSRKQFSPYKEYSHSIEQVTANSRAFFKQIDDELTRKEKLKLEYVRVRMSRIYFNDWKLDSNCYFRSLVILRKRLKKAANIDLLATKDK
ncbi:MAG: hypothetical protein AB7T49_00130 [Oligoflexales bacterium]